MSYIAARLSYEYGVPAETFVKMSPMDLKIHLQVLKDIVKERERVSRNKQRR